MTFYYKASSVSAKFLCWNLTNVFIPCQSLLPLSLSWSSSFPIYHWISQKMILSVNQVTIVFTVSPIVFSLKDICKNFTHFFSRNKNSSWVSYSSWAEVRINLLNSECIVQRQTEKRQFLIIHSVLSLMKLLEWTVIKECVWIRICTLKLSIMIFSVKIFIITDNINLTFVLVCYGQPCRIFLCCKFNVERLYKQLWCIYCGRQYI